MTDPRPEDALAHAAAELRRRGQRFALGGGLAISVRGEVRATRGVDLAVAREQGGPAIGMTLSGSCRSIRASTSPSSGNASRRSRPVVSPGTRTCRRSSTPSSRSGMLWPETPRLATAPQRGATKASHKVRRRRATCVDRKSTRLNSSHGYISYAVFCLKKKKKKHHSVARRQSVVGLAPSI